MALRKRRYKDKQKVKGGVLKRTRARARKLGTLDEVSKGGITGAEAREVRGEYRRQRKPAPSGSAPRHVRRRAEGRLDYLEENGGLGDLAGIRRGGITRPEARKIRRAWQTERTHNPLRPRSGRDILREATALTEQEFAPQEAELGRERQYETGRQNVLYGPGGWFEGYQREVAAAAQRQQAAEAAFQAGLQQASSQAMQQNVDAQMQLQQQSAATGAKGGTAPDPGLAQMAAQAAAGQHQASLGFQRAMGQVGTANTGLLNALSVAAGQQGQEGLRESQARVTKIQELARELGIAKGNAQTANIGKLKDTERTYDLSRQAFGLDVAEAQEDARHNRQNERENRAARRAAQRENDRDYRRWKREFGAERADEMYSRMEKDRRFQLDRKKFGFEKAKERYRRRHPNMGKGGDTPASGPKKGLSESERDKFDTAVNLLRAIDRKRGAGHVRKTRTDALTALVQDKGIPPRIARRALQSYLRKQRKSRNVPPILEGLIGDVD